MSDKLTPTERAARCWCDPRTEGRTMDPILCQVVAEAIEQAEMRGRDDSDTAKGMYSDWKRAEYNRAIDDCIAACNGDAEEPLRWARQQMEALKGPAND